MAIAELDTHTQHVNTAEERELESYDDTDWQNTMRGFMIGTALGLAMWALLAITLLIVL
jgi:tetrahydromethanopterin S-methyltransferase subunit B